jgi:hypothetical protein
MQTSVQPYKFEQLLQKSHAFDRHVITVQVMAIAEMSPADQNSVRAALKRPQDMMG